MSPSDMAASPARSVTKFPLAESRPLPPRSSSVSPSRWSLPTRTSVRKSSPVGEECSPILRKGLDCSRPGHAPVEDEGQDLAVADRGVGAVVELGVEHDGVGVGPVGDERLVPVEDVLVAVPSGHGLHPAQGVGSRVGLGDGPGPDLFDGEQVEPPALHLGRGALLHDGPAGQAQADAHGRDDARTVVAQLDDGDEGHGRRTPVPGPPAPILLGLGPVPGRLALQLPLEAVPSHLVHAEGGVQLADDVVGGQVPVLEGLDVRDHLGLDEPPHGLPHHQLLFGPLEHDRPPEYPDTTSWCLRG